MEEREDGYCYDGAGNQVGYHGRIKKEKPQDFTFILVLGIGIAIFSNADKWRLAIINYFQNILHHPTQLFHLDTVLFLLFTFIIFYQIIKLVIRRFI